MIHPNTVERTIIIIEKDKRVHRHQRRPLPGRDHVIEQNIGPDSRKSSEKDPINPPKTIRAGSPVKLIRKAKSTPMALNSRIAR